MALEQVFECPRTLRRLRSGPLGKLLEGFCNWLLEHGFSRWKIRKHLFHVKQQGRILNNKYCEMGDILYLQFTKDDYCAHCPSCRESRE